MENLEKSDCLLILEATEAAEQEARERGRGGQVNVRVRLKEEGNRTGFLMMRALREGVSHYTLRIVYANSKDAINGIIDQKLADHPGKNQDIHLTKAERDYVRTQFLYRLMRIMLATAPIIEEDPTRVAIITDSTSTALELFTTNPELVEAIFESAYADAIVEWSAKIVREAALAAIGSPQSHENQPS